MWLRKTFAALVCLFFQLAAWPGLCEARPVTRTLAIVKPDAWDSKAHIEAEMLKAGFTFAARTVMILDAEAIGQFYQEHTQKPFFTDLLMHMAGKPVGIYVLERQSAIGVWRAIMGPTDPAEAQTAAPKSLRAKFGTDITKNAVHGSDSLEAARREIAYFFPDQVGMDGVDEEGDVYDFDLTQWDLTAKEVVWAKEGGYDSADTSRHAHLRTAMSIMDLTEEDLQLLPESARELVMTEIERQRQRIAGIPAAGEVVVEEDEYEDPEDTEEAEAVGEGLRDEL